MSPSERRRQLNIRSLTRDQKHRRRHAVSEAPLQRRVSISNPLSRFKLLLNPDYVRLWSIGVALNTVFWLETVALSIYVYELADSAFAVGFIGFLRLAPLLLLGAFIGTIADRVNRRVMLATTNITVAIVYLILGVLVVTGRIEFWHISVGAFIGGALWATDFPVRRAMIGDCLPADRLSAAFGVDMASGNFARIFGPLVGGVFIQAIGMQGVYFLGSAMFGVASLIATSMLLTRTGGIGTRAAADTASDRTSDLRAGLRHIRTDTVLFVTIIVTVVMNIFAFPYHLMIPVIGTDKLHADPVLVGLLFSVEGVGATLGALVVAALAQPRHFTRVFTYSSAGLLAILIVFAFAPWYWIALPLLFIAGFAMSGFATMQSVIVVISTNPAMRGRVLGVLTVAIGSGPIGALIVGILGNNIGGDKAVFTIAAIGLALTAATVLASRRYLRSIPRPRR